LARLVTGWAADKIVTPRTILISVGIVDVLAGGWLGTVTPATSPSLLLPMLAVLGAFAIGWAGVQQAEAARMSPAGMVGSGTGAVYFGTFVGGMIMPIIFTVLRDLTGRSLLALGIVCCLAAAGPLLIVRGYRGRENAPENASPPAKSGAAA
jgi:nitrate/nitrite transporter NarK